MNTDTLNAKWRDGTHKAWYVETEGVKRVHMDWTEAKKAFEKTEGKAVLCRSDGTLIDCKSVNLPVA